MKRISLFVMSFLFSTSQMLFYFMNIIISVVFCSFLLCFPLFFYFTSLTTLVLFSLFSFPHSLSQFPLCVYHSNCLSIILYFISPLYTFSFHLFSISLISLCFFVYFFICLRLFFVCFVQLTCDFRSR
jgi:hypothetical protein